MDLDRTWLETNLCTSNQIDRQGKQQTTNQRPNKNSTDESTSNGSSNDTPGSKVHIEQHCEANLTYGTNSEYNNVANWPETLPTSTVETLLDKRFNTSNISATVNSIFGHASFNEFELNESQLIDCAASVSGKIMLTTDVNGYIFEKTSNKITKTIESDEMFSDSIEINSTGA